MTDDEDDYYRGYNDCAKMFLSHPPGDWRSFGSSIDPVTGKAPDYELEFAGMDEGGDPLWERPAVRTTVEWGIKALFDRGTILPKPAEHALDAVRRFPEDWALVRRTVTDWTQVHP